jgi:hypothetical protein
MPATCNGGGSGGDSQHLEDNGWGNNIEHMDWEEEQVHLLPLHLGMGCLVCYHIQFIWHGALCAELWTFISFYVADTIVE